MEQCDKIVNGASCLLLPGLGSKGPLVLSAAPFVRLLSLRPACIQVPAGEVCWCLCDQEPQSYALLGGWPCRLSSAQERVSLESHRLSDDGLKVTLADLKKKM